MLNKKIFNERENICSVRDDDKEKKKKKEKKGNPHLPQPGKKYIVPVKKKKTLLPGIFTPTITFGVGVVGRRRKKERERKSKKAKKLIRWKGTTTDSPLQKELQSSSENLPPHIRISGDMSKYSDSIQRRRRSLMLRSHTDDLRSCFTRTNVIRTKDAPRRSCSSKRRGMHCRRRSD